MYQTKPIRCKLCNETTPHTAFIDWEPPRFKMVGCLGHTIAIVLTGTIWLWVLLALTARDFYKKALAHSTARFHCQRCGTGN